MKPTGWGKSYLGWYWYHFQGKLLELDRNFCFAISHPGWAVVISGKIPQKSVKWTLALHDHHHHHHQNPNPTPLPHLGNAQRGMFLFGWGFTMPMMTQKIISQNPGNWQTVIRSSILATIFILICAYISNHKIFFALDEESPMATGRFDSTLTLVNDNFMVGFCWLWIIVEIMMSPLWLYFRIPSLLVKWPSLQPYFVTILSSISGLHQQCKFLFFSTIPMFFLECWLLILLISQGLRGDHWVLYNYIRGERKFQVTKQVYSI